MDKPDAKIPDAAKYAAGGAAVALVMAVFTPAPVLLALEAAVAAGLYVYNRRSKHVPASKTTVDVDSGENNETKKES